MTDANAATDSTEVDDGSSRVEIGVMQRLADALGADSEATRPMTFDRGTSEVPLPARRGA